MRTFFTAKMNKSYVQFEKCLYFKYLIVYKLVKNYFLPLYIYISTAHLNVGDVSTQVTIPFILVTVKILTNNKKNCNIFSDLITS